MADEVAGDDAPADAPFRAPGRFDVDTLASVARDLPDGVHARVAGRVMLWRNMGSLVFGTIQDRSGRVQVSLRKQELGPEVFKPLAKGVSLGDFIGVDGELWTTDRGEKTVGASSVEVLQRARLPMPDKHAGVNDPDLRYRKRYLDLLVNEESRERFLVRSRMVSATRRWLDGHGFVEVETPVLTDAASGAAARPFSTHHEALDRDFYLRISPETYLKRVVAGGLDRVYELGRNFRNEGIDASHLQEFTMLEWYAAYWDYRDNMRAVRELVQDVLTSVLGTTTVTFSGTELEFGGEWPEVDYREAVAEHAGIDLTQLRDLDSLREAVRGAGLGDDLAEAPSYASMVDRLYKRTVRPHLTQPCFLVHHPAELVPLARRSDDDPSVLDMFQVVVHGWEVVKAYSELVDPDEQEARLLEQVALREAGDTETMMMEDDFLEAMRHGMPPMSGLGLGIDRLVAIATDAPTLRDVVLFPTLGKA